MSGRWVTQITANLSTENPKKLYIRRSYSTALDFLLKDFVSRLASAPKWLSALCCDFNPASTQMIDGTEKHKIPSKFAKLAAQYKEFDNNLGVNFER